MRIHKRPCACGSGRPARDCCGFMRRLTPAECAAAFLARQAKLARDVMGPFSPVAQANLRAEAVTLPTRCDLFTESLLAGPPPVQRAVREMQRDAAFASQQGLNADAMLSAVAGRADSVVARVIIAKCLIALRESGEVDEHLVAAALIELAGPRSPLCEAALLEAARPTHHEPATVPSRATPAWS